jgi:hypothetical protein
MPAASLSASGPGLARTLRKHPVPHFAAAHAWHSFTNRLPLVTQALLVIAQAFAFDI